MDKNISKIHIIGGPGSGKTYLGEKLAKYSGYEVLDLDDIYWDNKSDKYNTKNDEQQRNKRLTEFLEKSDYIVEGVYDKWLSKSFAKADVIIILKPNRFVRNYRIVKRFVLRKIGLVKAKKSNIIDLIKFLIWSLKYEKENLVRVLELKQLYKDKTYIFSNADDAFKFLAERLKK